MTRKIKKVVEDYEQLVSKVEETKLLIQEAQKEELDMIDSIKTNINQLSESNNLFCGVILSNEDILNIVKLAMETKEPIKIPYQLYFNE